MNPGFICLACMMLKSYDYRVLPNGVINLDAAGQTNSKQILLAKFADINSVPCHTLITLRTRHGWQCAECFLKIALLIIPKSERVNIWTNAITYCRSDNNIWWPHQMKTFSALLAFCAGNSPVTVEFPAQRPVTHSFDVSLVCTWTNSLANNGDAGDLRRHRAHYDVIVMN